MVTYLARGDVALSVSVAGVVVRLVAGSADAIKSAAGLVFVAVVLHNGLGLALGYGAGRLGRLGEPASRAMAFEVGMQNSGLAAVWHNVSGAVTAAWLSRRGR